MTIVIEDHTAGVQHGSRNGTVIDTLLNHTIEGTVEVAERIFAGTTRAASTQYGVSVEGNVWKWVEEANRAFGARGWNHRSIHIENEGFAKQTAYPNKQIDSLAQLWIGILERNTSIPRLLTAGNRLGIKGHGDVDPDRRWDPGVFPIAQLVKLVKHYGNIDLKWDTGVVLKSGEYDESWLVHYVQHIVGASIDGQYGPNTAKAVKVYQSSIGVFNDSEWGKQTWAAHYSSIADDLWIPSEIVQVPANVEPTKEQEEMRTQLLSLVSSVKDLTAIVLADGVKLDEHVADVVTSTPHS